MWLTAGDKNSKFFHAVTVANRRKIFNPALKDSNKIWRELREEVESMLIEEFTNLYEAEEIRRSEHLGDFFQTYVSNEENNLLDAILTMEEIWYVVKNMPLTKVLGPDGCPFYFSKNIGVL